MVEKAQEWGGISDDAVSKATGRSWSGWLEFLDGEGARQMGHKEIVALVASPGGIANGWWQQSVAIGYEQARGMRVVGQTSEGGYQIGVQKTLPLASETAWGLLTEGPGRDIWLERAQGITFQPGEHYQAGEAIWGEIRTVAPGQRIRLTWHSPDLARPSTLQVTVVPSGDRASVRFHQEGLSSLEEREQMREHWRQALEQLLEYAKTQSS